MTTLYRICHLDTDAVHSIGYGIVMGTFHSLLLLLLTVCNLKTLQVKCWSDVNDVDQQFQSQSHQEEAFFSCRELSESMEQEMMSGTYIIHLPSGYYEAYCETGINEGVYTFLSARSATLLREEDIKYLITDVTNVLLRISKADGTQPYTLIQPHNNENGELSVQLNSHIRNTSPLNWHMGPYLYLGVVDNRGDISGQGFRSNGQQIKYGSCHGNISNYFAFFPNPREQKVVLRPQQKQKHERGLGAKVEEECLDWRSSSVRPVSGRRMPLEFFMFTEVRLGGSCGCYSTSDKWMDSQWKGHGTAIGVR